jgi:nitrate reductase delta subunit
MRSRGEPELFQVASVLLRYPDMRLVAATEELEAAVAGLHDREAREALGRFLERRRGMSQLDLEREYVETFDTRRRCTLNVSYYVYGDTRRRGVALLRLKRLYAAAGLVLDSGELPDHLPVLLEFAAFAPADYGTRLLAEQRIGIELLRQALASAESPYALVLDAVSRSLPRLGVREAGAVRKLAAEGPPDESVGLEPFAPPEVMPGEARV